MDYELMPVGTRAALQEAALLFRQYEQHHLDVAKRTGARTGREEKAERNRVAAERLEVLLAQPEAHLHPAPVDGAWNIEPA